VKMYRTERYDRCKVTEVEVESVTNCFVTLPGRRREARSSDWQNYWETPAAAWDHLEGTAKAELTAAKESMIRADAALARVQAARAKAKDGAS
jgi:hypothetical protein